MNYFFTNIWNITKREVKGYFYTPLAFVFIGVFSLLMGWMFGEFLRTYFVYSQTSQFGMAPSITIDRLAEAFYANMHVILMFILPFFTMRLFSEEARQNTLTLLMTSPIRTWELTLAKFFAGGFMLFLQLAVTFFFPICLTLFSAEGPTRGPDMGVVATTYLGLFLCGLVYVSIGLFWSSVTESQLVAVVLTFSSCFGLWLLGMGAQGSEGGIQEFRKHFAINEQFTSLLKGTIETKSLVYFITFIFLALFLTNRSLESRSWRS